MDIPRRETVLSVSPNRRGEWEVLYVANDGVRRETFASSEAAKIFVHDLTPIVVPETWAQRVKTIELQTKRIEEDRNSRSKYLRLSSVILTASSILATVTATLILIYTGLSGGLTDFSGSELAALLTSVAALISFNIANLYSIRSRQKIEREFRRASLTADWTTRAWAAASADMHIESPKVPESLRRNTPKDPRVDLETSN